MLQAGNRPACGINPKPWGWFPLSEFLHFVRWSHQARRSIEAEPTSVLQRWLAAHAKRCVRVFRAVTSAFQISCPGVRPIFAIVISATVVIMSFGVVAWLVWQERN
jgi:hypothetical protein